MLGKGTLVDHLQRQQGNISGERLCNCLYLKQNVLTYSRVYIINVLCELHFSNPIHFSGFLIIVPSLSGILQILDVSQLDIHKILLMYLFVSLGIKIKHHVW